MHRKTTLPNGLRVLTETMPAVRSATVGVWADVGSAVETEERRGISHLVEHMLFKGTQRRSARQIAETMDGVGGNLNAFTDKETTCYYAKVIDRHVPLALDVLADMFLHSAFDQQELAKEQKVVLEEIKMYEDSPDDLIHDVFLQTMWRGSSLGEPTIGFADTIVRVTPADLRAHMRESLRAEFGRGRGCRKRRARPVRGTGLRAVRGVRGRLRAAAARTARRHPGAERSAQGERTGVRRGGDARYRHSRRAALRAFSTRHRAWGRHVEPALPGDPRTARPGLQRLFVPGGLSCRRPLRRLCRHFARNVQSCIDVILEQFARVRNVPIGDDEFQLAKEHIKGNLTLTLESTSSRMIRLVRNEFALGRQVTPEEIEQRIDAVTALDVQELARELLVDQNLGLCIIGPIDASQIVWSRYAA